MMWPELEVLKMSGNLFVAIPKVICHMKKVLFSGRVIREEKGEEKGKGDIMIYRMIYRVMYERGKSDV